MSVDPRITLPVLATPAKPMPFPVGAKVFLRSAAFGTPGVVRGTQRKKIAVFWKDIGYVGKHAPSALTLAADAERP
jgi:hypothetical protein